ncbi:uncharacterized protein [Chelonus insularis]|uniref:uncharacterized protein n=1 Tax=Chelonus insularis TaxID=460826 RepID=UPI00158B0CA6|nr:uncharacterized protein LOC118070956 [Chelonus insularis]
MNSLGFILTLLSIVSFVSGATRYLAIPIDGIDIIEVNPMSQRVTRQAEAYSPITYTNHQRNDVDHQSSPRIDRLQPILDYVDFGSQSGSNGAFSWFADYPARH